jgi:hypothetical protein
VASDTTHATDAPGRHKTPTRTRESFPVALRDRGACRACPRLRGPGSALRRPDGAGESLGALYGRLWP